jgi:hypothetical protein
MLQRLIASCAIVLTVSATANAQPRSNQQRLAVDIFKELVEINTVTATGDTARDAEAMAAHLRAAGLGGSDVQVFVPAPRKGNLVVLLRSTGARRPILFLAHLDVVDARPETGRSILSGSRSATVTSMGSGPEGRSIVILKGFR